MECTTVVDFSFLGFVRGSHDDDFITHPTQSANANTISIHCNRIQAPTA